MIRTIKLIRRMLFMGALTGVAVSATTGCQAQAPRTYSSADILQQMKQLRVVGSVLYIAAHPDDENTRLLAYLAREKDYRTAYMSLTRGDGGQNLLGDEQGVELGLIRTQELLSARRIDGAEQFFSRAYDFGFSKSPKEALRIWQEDSILSDVVWVIRNFKPDVIITRFPEDGRAGHGHHSASAILAREAFEAAADPKRFPEQLADGVHPWKAKRILWNTFNFGGNNTTDDSQLKMDVGGYNALLGKSYGEIAAESRSQHKSQGFGATAVRGNATEYFAPVAGDPATHDLMDGVATDWSRLGDSSINMAVDSMIQAYDTQHPSRSLPALENIRSRVESMKVSDWTIYKLRQIDQLENACSGLWMEAYVGRPAVVPGEYVPVTVSLINRGPEQLKLVGISINGTDTTIGQAIPQNSTVNVVVSMHVGDHTPVTQPYWLVNDKTEGRFVVNDLYEIGKPQNDPPFTASITLGGEDGRRNVHIPVQYKHTDPVRGELYEPVEVTPAFLLRFKPDVILASVVPAVNPVLQATLTAMKDVNASSITFHFDNTDGTPLYSTTPPDVPKAFQKDHSYSFTLPYEANNIKGDGGKTVRVSADVTAEDGSHTTYDLGLKQIEYPHIPTIHYFQRATVQVLGDEIRVKGKRIGYIEGAGDKLPVYLPLMGYQVTMLNEQDLMSRDLSGYDAIITGIRAFNTQPWLKSALPRLMEYVKNGGVLLEQYNNFSGLVAPNLGPYPFRVGSGRVTDESAAVTFLEPANAAFHYPNEITPKDFEGWTQERGLYYVDDSNLDPHYKALLSMQDPGESVQKGSLIVAAYGKGKFVYTSLAFFRQLPKGVPGAYRLMANLLAKPVVK